MLLKIALFRCLLETLVNPEGWICEFKNQSHQSWILSGHWSETGASGKSRLALGRLPETSQP